MSRIGKKPIEIPDGVIVTQDKDVITVKGPKGTLFRKIPKDIDVDVDGNVISVKRLNDNKKGRSLHGLIRTLISNMVTGVHTGFTKSLDIVGVGYRGEIDDKILKLHVGFSKPVEYNVPDGVTINLEKQVNIAVSGIDKELIGRVASEIRGIKKPEPYKGKGIRYTGETVRRKVGKSAGA